MTQLPHPVDMCRVPSTPPARLSLDITSQKHLQLPTVQSSAYYRTKYSTLKLCSAHCRDLLGTQISTEWFTALFSNCIELMFVWVGGTYLLITTFMAPPLAQPNIHCIWN